MVARVRITPENKKQLFAQVICTILQVITFYSERHFIENSILPMNNIWERYFLGTTFSRGTMFSEESIKKITINDLVSKDVTVKESKTIEIIRPRKL